MRLDNWFITNPDASQQEILKVSINENLIVKGAAGSGKTNMAILRAIQAKDNNFAIVVYTVALKKMVRYGLSKLGLDKDRVVHEWSWINRGIEISGDLFCIKGRNYFGLSPDLLILNTSENVTFFIAKEKYSLVLSRKSFFKYAVLPIENPIEVSVDFDKWVDERFYKTFQRRTRWFKEVQVSDFQINNNDKLLFMPGGFLFKKQDTVNHLIIDEGQDFSIENYRDDFINRANHSISIFGDTSQQIYSDRGTSIDMIQSEFNYSLKNLKYNYRIPKTIARIAQKIAIPNLDLITQNRKNNGDSDYPQFPRPLIKKCNSEDEELHYILNRITAEEMDDVAILLPNNRFIEKVNNFFSNNGLGTQVRYTVELTANKIAKNFPTFRSVDTLKFINQDLICILTFHSAKGTEFENVFIPFADEDNNIERNAFYVAVTRSSYRLFITYSRELTSTLEDVNPLDIISQ